jgi:hypothetical protein
MDTSHIRYALALTDAEREAVGRLRYDVYVEEMGRYRATADHEARCLREPEDETGWIFYAADGDEVVATARLSWGGAGPFSRRQVEQYSIQPFLERMAPEEMAIGERGMVVARLRGSDVFSKLFSLSRQLVREKRIQLIFGACEPHLLSLYLSQGQRTYSRTNINSPEAGYLIPLVTVVEDYEYFRRLNVRNLAELHDHGADARIPACVDELINTESAVTSSTILPPTTYMSGVRRAFEELDSMQLSALDGMSDEEIERCLAKSNVIECSMGDRVLKKGGAARNLFVVLKGDLEVRDGEQVLARIGPGEVFGEIAFLLGRPRTKDVYAASDEVQVLSLSEGLLRQLIREDSSIAANMLLNIAKMLCVRLINMG